MAVSTTPTINSGSSPSFALWWAGSDRSGRTVAEPQRLWPIFQTRVERISVRKTLETEMQLWPLFEHNCCLCLPACTYTYVYTRTNLTRSRLGDVSTKAWQLILRLWHSCAATRMKSFLPSIILPLSLSLDFFRVKGSYSYSYRPAYRTSYLLHPYLPPSSSLPSSPSPFVSTGSAIFDSYFLGVDKSLTQ